MLGATLPHIAYCNFKAASKGTYDKPNRAARLFEPVEQKIMNVWTPEPTISNANT